MEPLIPDCWIEGMKRLFINTLYLEAERGSFNLILGPCGRVGAFWEERENVYFS